MGGSLWWWRWGGGGGGGIVCGGGVVLEMVVVVVVVEGVVVVVMMEEGRTHCGLAEGPRLTSSPEVEPEDRCWRKQEGRIKTAETAQRWALKCFILIRKM